MLVSNTHDSFTPVAAAELMAQRFGRKSARLVTNHAFGHCSISQPSLCVAKLVREYFVHGTLPDHNTTCHAAFDWPFVAIDYSKVEPEEIELMRWTESMPAVFL